MKANTFFFPLVFMGAISICSLSAKASILFSDLGTGPNVYSNSSGYYIAGSASATSPISYMVADLFTLSGTGTAAVTELDLGVTNVETPSTVDAAIFTDDSGTPGSQVSGALWDSLTVTETSGLCCTLVTISGITDVSLIGGQSYFLVLGPASSSSTSLNDLMYNTLAVTGDTQRSTDGGTTWDDLGSSSFLGAFDVLGNSVPEPGSVLLFGIGCAGILAARRRRSIR